MERKLPLRRPGQKLLSFWVWLVVRSRDRATPPTKNIDALNVYTFACALTLKIRNDYTFHNVPRETMTETTRQLCLRAAQQQTGASPVTAVTIGSGSAALVG